MYHQWIFLRAADREFLYQMLSAKENFAVTGCLRFPFLAVCTALSAISLFFSSAVITGHLLCLKLLCFLPMFSIIFT